jgi:hypothetical protein
MCYRFDLRAFHDAVLAHGAVPLSSLERIVHDFAEGAPRSALAPGGRRYVSR